MLDNVVETLKRYWTLVYGRQWENWQLLTIAAAAGLLLLLLIAMRRRRKTRAKRANTHTTASQPEITDHQRMKFFQQEIIKRDYTEARLEREISYLNADSEELRGKLAEMETANQQLLCEGGTDGKPSGQDTARLKADVKRLRRQVEEGKQACERAEQEIVELTTANKQIQDTVTEITNTNEQLRQEVEAGETASQLAKQEIAELTAINEQLRSEAGRNDESSGKEMAELKVINERLAHQVEEGRQASECARQEISELTGACKQLRDTVTEITNTNEQLRQEAEAGKTASQRAELQIAELTAINERLQNEAGRTDELSEKEMAELKVASEKLAHQVAEGNKAAGRSRQEITILTAANRQLQDEVNELRSANERLREELEESEKGPEHSERESNGLTAAREQRRRAAAERKRTGADKAGDRRQTGASGLTWSVVEKMVPHSQVGVKAKSPARQLRELAEQVAESNVQMGGEETQDAGKEAILHACDYLDADNAVMAVDALKKFVNSVQAQQSDNGEVLQKEDAEHLIAAAREIIDLLETQ